jgi:hypothetical protein
MTEPPLRNGERVWIVMSGRVVGARHNLKDRLTGVIVDLSRYNGRGAEPSVVTVPRIAVRRVRRGPA